MKPSVNQRKPLIMKQNGSKYVGRSVGSQNKYIGCSRRRTAPIQNKEKSNDIMYVCNIT